MFGLNLKALALAAGLSLAAGFGSGVWVRDAFCDAAAAEKVVDDLQAQITSLKEQVQRQQDAAAEDAVKSAAQSAVIADLERKLKDAESRVSDGVCLPPDDADRLRDLWN